MTRRDYLRFAAALAGALAAVLAGPLTHNQRMLVVRVLTLCNEEYAAAEVAADQPREGGGDDAR